MEGDGITTAERVEELELRPSGSRHDLGEQGEGQRAEQTLSAEVRR